MEGDQLKTKGKGCVPLYGGNQVKGRAPLQNGNQAEVAQEEKVEENKEENGEEVEEVGAGQEDGAADIEAASLPVNFTGNIRTDTKLRILSETLRILYEQTEGVNLTRKGRVHDTPDRVCDRFIEEGKIQSRFNATRIWCSVNNINASDVTFVSQMSFSRVRMLARVAAHWTGPMSVAMYVPREELRLVAPTLAGFPALLDREDVELHVVVEHGVSCT